jgi:hypothetical protein
MKKKILIACVTVNALRITFGAHFRSSRTRTKVQDCNALISSEINASEPSDSNIRTEQFESLTKLEEKLRPQISSFSCVHHQVTTINYRKKLLVTM